MTYKETRLLMGMPITVEIVDKMEGPQDIEDVFAYLIYIDETFSTYKDTSEISRINRGELTPEEYSDDMKTVFALSQSMKQSTHGYFDIMRGDGTYDPSGLVKGWAIEGAVDILSKKGFSNFFVDAGGDVQVSGHNAQDVDWKVGIRNPFHRDEIVKVVSLHNEAIATSGTYIRGAHIYNPLNRSESLNDVVSLTVIGPTICDTDCYATAAFAMGYKGIRFIENIHGFEGYMIDKEGMATMTTGFERYCVPH
ncbi:MAG: FAD:protein FMN transferase [Patescibacteria group bacterium]|nr:FAD:protein FMN transferase [Patescibacteria group bacterium]MDE2437926.1 FAD:protein FMN transferase [Patescibacteria group bacterium]